MKKLLNYMIILLMTQQTCFGYSVDDLLNPQATHETSFFTVIGALAFVIALIFLTGFIYTKLNVVGSNLAKKSRQNDLEDKVLVLSSTHLNNNQTLHVVEVNGKKMLLGATQSSVTVLKDLGEAKENTINNEMSNFPFEQETPKPQVEVKEEKPPIDQIFDKEDIKEDLKSKVDDEEDFGLYKKYL